MAFTCKRFCVFTIYFQTVCINLPIFDRHRFHNFPSYNIQFSLYTDDYYNANSLAVPVLALTLSPTELSVNSGNIISLECQTNYCNPPSTIIWYIDGEKVSGQIKVTIDTNSTGISRTTSVLQYTAVPSDDGKPVYCTATNFEGYIIESRKHYLNVKCEFFILIWMLQFSRLDI